MTSEIAKNHTKSHFGAKFEHTRSFKLIRVTVYSHVMMYTCIQLQRCKHQQRTALSTHRVIQWRQLQSQHGRGGGACVPAAWKTKQTPTDNRTAQLVTYIVYM